MVTAMRAKPRITLRREVWDIATQRAGLTTDSLKAEALGISRAGVNRVQNGHIQPSNDFIASACTVLGLGMEDLFRIERSQGMAA